MSLEGVLYEVDTDFLNLLEASIIPALLLRDLLLKVHLPPHAGVSTSLTGEKDKNTQHSHQSQAESNSNSSVQPLPGSTLTHTIPMPLFAPS